VAGSSGRPQRQHGWLLAPCYSQATASYEDNCYDGIDNDCDGVIDKQVRDAVSRSWEAHTTTGLGNWAASRHITDHMMPAISTSDVKMGDAL
jgi:hypothetical protein